MKSGQLISKVLLVTMALASGIAVVSAQPGMRFVGSATVSPLDVSEASFRFRNTGDLLVACVYGDQNVSSASYDGIELSRLGDLPSTHPNVGYAGVTMFASTNLPRGNRIFAANGGFIQGVVLAAYRGVLKGSAPDAVAADVFEDFATSHDISIQTTTDNTLVVGCHANSSGSIEEGTVSNGVVREVFRLNGYLLFDSATPISSPGSFESTISWPEIGIGGEVLAAFKLQ